MIQHEKKPTRHEHRSATELDQHDIEKVAGGLLTSTESSSTSPAKSKGGKIEYTWKVEEGVS